MEPAKDDNAGRVKNAQLVVSQRGGCKQKLSDWGSQLWILKAPLMVLIAVLGTLPLLLLVPTSEGRCAYVLVVMAILWLTEAIPIPVTSLLPVFMFPMVGVLSAKETANSYMGKTSLLFIGGLLVAIAVEETNLHRRLALNVLRLVGADPKWIMFGLMLPTWFLSMWISNTATASMMVPIVEAILQQLKEAEDDATSISPPATPKPKRISKRKNRQEVALAKSRIGEYGVYRQNSRENSGSGAVSPSPNSIDIDMFINQSFDVPGPGDTSIQMSSIAAVENGMEKLNPDLIQPSLDHTNSSNNSNNGGTSKANGDIDPEGVGTKNSKDGSDDDSEYRRLCKALSLCVAYAANTGGIATLTGTPPNLVFSGQAESLYKKYNAKPGVTFLNWLLMGFPLALVLMVLCWFWLGLFFLRRRFFTHDVSRKKAVQKLIHKEHKKIGKISFAEISTLVLFILLALLWLTRKPEFTNGWDDLFQEDFVGDSTCAVLIGCLFFILPGKRPQVFCCRKSNQVASYTPLLTWQTAQRKLPWGIIVLLGGGFALAKACERSGLSGWLGEQLASFDSLEPWLLNLAITAIVAMATEVTSNTATATLLMPVMFELSLRLKTNPLYLMSSTALATSFAFMMPVATPPNAIVFAQGRLTIPDMAAAGAGMNVLAILTLTLCINTWGTAIFGLDTLPEAFQENSTLLVLAHS